MLSMKTRYAMMALTKLASEYGNGPIQINDIAQIEKIPRRFLENILLELKDIGLLGSKLGKKGGYYLLQKPDSVNLAQIVRHFEGSIAMLYCVSEKSYQPCEFCKDESKCTLRNTFMDIREYSLKKLESTTLASLI